MAFDDTNEMLDATQVLDSAKTQVLDRAEMATGSAKAAAADAADAAEAAAADATDAVAAGEQLTEVAESEEPGVEGEEPDAIDADASDEQIEPADSSEPAEVTEEENTNDSLTFSNGVIEKIVAIAVREVPGVLGMKGGFVNRIQETFGATVATKGVTVEITPDNTMSVNISVIMEYGAYAPQVFEDVKKVVVQQIAGMTGLDVGGVNLRIEDVMTADEYKRSEREDEESEAE